MSRGAHGSCPGASSKTLITPTTVRAREQVYSAHKIVRLPHAAVSHARAHCANRRRPAFINEIPLFRWSGRCKEHAIQIEPWNVSSARRRTIICKDQSNVGNQLFQNAYFNVHLPSCVPRANNHIDLGGNFAPDWKSFSRHLDFRSTIFA